MYICKSFQYSEEDSKHRVESLIKILFNPVSREIPDLRNTYYRSSAHAQMMRIVYNCS